MKLKTPTYRTRLSFTKEDLQSRVKLDIDYAGISLGSRARKTEYNRATESLGWFGSDSDSNKFYPGVDVQADVVPKPEDFIEQDFRLITATTVGAGSWKATDFSDPGILESSLQLLIGKPVYKMHDTDVNNWVGFVKNTVWQGEYTDDDGIIVPPGINGRLAIDGKTEPKMARGILMGAVYSNSVTVEFDWKPSHVFTDPWEFESKIGTYDKDGVMIRRIVTYIHAYHETSMVFLGADPFAKLIDKNGKLRNIDITGISYDKVDDKTKEDYKDRHKLGALYGMEAKTFISLSKSTNEPNSTKITNTKTNNQMNKFFAAFVATFATSLGLTATATEADFKEEHLDKIKNLKLADPEAEKKVGFFTKFYEAALTFLKITKPDTASFEVDAFLADNTFISKTELTRLQGLATEHGTLTAAKAAWETEKASLTADATIGKGFLKMKRDETVRLYKLAMQGKEDAAVITLIQNAGADALDGLLKQYAKGATHKFSGKCKGCGSEEFEFRSTYGNVDSDGGDASESVGHAHFAAKYGQSSLFIGKTKETAKDDK